MKSETSRAAREIAVLHEISGMIGSSLNFRTSLQKTFEALDSKLGMTHGIFRLFHPATHEITMEVAYGMREDARRQKSFKLGEAISGRVVDEGVPKIIPRMDEDACSPNVPPGADGAGREEMAFICVPIKLGSDTMGAISVERPFVQGSDYPEDLRFLSIVASMLAQSVKLKNIMDDEEHLLVENTILKDELKEKYNIHNMIGNSGAMQLVYENIIKAAQSNATILIRGESGTGKELVAHAIHYNSPRSKKPFVKVNCGAIPENLIESELFGYEKGAFPGATERKKGKFESADGGTIFLGEIAELSLDMQVRLLRVLREKEFERVGGMNTIQSNVRILAAANRNLEDEISDGRFRAELYHRLNGFPIYIPPLRDRKTDILLLAEHFLHKYVQENGKNITRLSTLAIDLLNSYHWPGNVREVQNCMERAVLVCDADTIQSTHLPPTLQRADTVNSRENLSLAHQVEHFEKELIIDALKKSRGIKSKAAKHLSTTERILGYKMKQYRIDYKVFRR